MSLINEMLRDLEARGGQVGAASTRSTPAVRRVPRWPVFVLGFLVLVLAIALAWMLMRDPPPAIAANDRLVDAAPEREADVTRASTPVASTLPAETPAEHRDATVNPVAERADVAVAVVDPEPSRLEASQPAPVKEAAKAVEEAEAPSKGASVNLERADVNNETVIVRRHEPTPAEKAARAARDGFAALRAGDWTTAARLLQELVAFEPANDDAREGLAVALSQQGRIAEADGVLVDGIAVAATPSRFAKLRARLQLARGETAAALDSLSVAIPAVAADPEFHALKAALAQQVGDFTLAEDGYSALTALEPANGTWQAGLGMARDALGDSAGALVAFENALAAGRLDAALLAHVQRRVAALKQE